MFNTLITGPLGSILAFINSFVGNYGVAIFLFCFAVKLILFPLTLKSKRAMFATARLQPKMQELQKKYKNDKNQYSIELQKLYKDEKASPMSGCLPMLITLPILFGLYYVVISPLTYLWKLSAETIQQIATNLATILTSHGGDALLIENLTKFAGGGRVSAIEITIADNMARYSGELNALMPELADRGTFNFSFLGLNLSQTPTYQFSAPNFSWGLLALLAISVGTSFLSSFLLQKLNPSANAADPSDPSAKSAQSTGKFMAYMAPLMTLFIGFSVPAALSLYWIANNVMSIASEFVATKMAKKKEEEIMQKRAEDEARKKRNKKKAADLEEKERLEKEKLFADSSKADPKS